MESTNTNDKELRALKKSVNALAKELRHQNSKKYQFGIGIIIGLGRALGATVVFALLIAALVQFVRTAENIPFLNTLTEKSGLHDFVEQNSE